MLSLKTVHVCPVVPDVAGEAAAAARLAKAARDANIAVVIEDEPAEDEFGFEHFIKHHSKCDCTR